MESNAVIPAGLRRHPFPVKAFFDYSLVLTYAFPEKILTPLLPPGLTLDTYEGWGFVAVALVQTRALRPAIMPAFLGRDFFLSGYRIFVRHQRSSGQMLRGLRILRSDTDSRLMALAGNALTHYNYRHCRVTSSRDDHRLSLNIRTPAAEADLLVSVDLEYDPGAPPAGSPFADWATARRFAGPLPFTFNYEKETHSLVIIEGVRENWKPRPVTVNVSTVTFFDQAPFAGEKRLLANSFLIERIPYRWKRGVLEPLSRTPTP